MNDLSILSIIELTYVAPIENVIPFDTSLQISEQVGAHFVYDKVSKAQLNIIQTQKKLPLQISSDIKNIVKTIKL